MMPLLKSISITNFRSIRGTIDVPLEAPIVLIHGQNGVGKTSLLSGIELVLTGAVESLRRSDAAYLSYLVHKECGEATIALTAASVGGVATRQLTVKKGEIKGKHLLSREDSWFFTERCYLAQATMAKLLELYQGKPTGGDSALTKFVKDLLGLDDLDNLLEGLHDAGHVTRLKNALPEYRELLERTPVLKANMERLTAQRSQLSGQLAAVQQRLAAVLAESGLPRAEEISDVELEQVVIDTTDARELQRIATSQRNLRAAREQWQGITKVLAGAAVEAAERASSEASAELAAWRKADGARIEATLKALAALFADIPDASIVGYQRALQEGLQLLGKELRRSRDLLDRDASATAQIAALDEQLQRATSRLAVLDEQIAGHLENADQLAKALTTILPFTNDSVCPVCDRDFSEVSSELLRTHVSGKISTLVESAGRLQAFVAERRDALRMQGEATRARDRFTSDRLEASAKTNTSLRLAEMTKLEQSLNGLESAAAEGDRRTSFANQKTRSLSEARGGAEQAVGFRERLKEFEETLKVPPMSSAEPTEKFLERLEERLVELERRHLKSQQGRLAAREELQEKKRVSGQLAEVEQRARVTGSELERLEAEHREFEALIKGARELAKIARSVKSEIVRKVFDNTLNALWRDLFIRLAPNEQFVPAFTLPEKDGGVVEALLETHYRSGGKGGNPRAMLSAGNLNTAALTLFLALHLSVANRLPCLIIDDPFQSMDEIHIAQLAALLRTLSRQHERQIIIAVHEKALFEYLALELYPASIEDRLITVELGTAADGSTVVDPHVIPFTPDKAVLAA